MKRRILAFICTLALFVGLLPAGAATVASAETTTGNTTYDVGYAIKNFNPWVASDTVVPEVTSEDEDGNAIYTVTQPSSTEDVEFLEDPENTEDKKIYPYLFSQSGNQIDWKSVVTDLHDDNGDGTVDHEDGIFATCTSVTYGKDTAAEKTVLFITTDTMKAWTNLVKAVRNKIVASDWGKELGIQADQIMVSSNHTHSGPQLDGTFNYYIDSTVFDTDEKIAKLKADREAYYNWVVDRIVAAAKESVEDQAPATMSKGAVDATEATAALNYNGGEGYHMNAIRHYERTLTSSLLWWSGEVSSIYANTAVPSHDKLVAALNEHDHDAKNIFNLQSNYTTSWSTTDDADNTMYVLRFEFEDSTKEPVVFVNWRAHSTMNSGILNHSVLSGDYATGLRTVLADEGYRAAFFLGAAGNVVAAPSSNVYKVDGALVKDKMDWLYEATDKNDSSLTLSETTKTFVYGRMLAEIAQYCMENTDTSGNSYMVDTPVGEIGTYHTSWKAEKNKYSEELLNAAIALRTEVMAAKEWDQATFESDYKVYLNENSSTYFPYYYKPNGTTVAIINSRLHFNAVYTQAKAVLDNGKTVADYTDAVELNAIKLGENVAFITSPNELADYYHDFTGDVTSHTTAEKEAHNDWFDLEDDAYGMPFVLGYSNQNSGYIAGWLDHQANSQTHATITGLGTDGYMLYSPGTYESMTSSFAAGQGEELIKVFDNMLDIASGEYDREAPCQHCSPNENVTWKPLTVDHSNTTVGAGHYYLYEDLAGTGTGGQWAVGSSTAPQETCIDLRGHTKFSETRNFTVPSGSTLNIMDTEGGGRIHSQTFSNNPGGGNFSISSGGTVNLYGGTLSFTKLDNTSYYGVGVGGIVSLQGTLNMYGGTIEGADMVNSSYTSSKESTGAYFTNNGCGGAVYVYDSGKLNVYGGSITSGSVPDKVTVGTVGTPKESVGKGPCVFLAGTGSRVKVSGNAVVEDIYYNKLGGAILSVSGAYTGTAALTFDSALTITDGMDIGNSDGADLTNANISCTNNPLASVYVHEADLKLSIITEDTVAVAYNAAGRKAYDSLTAAASVYTDGYIKLLKDVTTEVAVSKDVYLDLAGYSVTGQLTVGDGSTLYAMDSNTNDYTVEDGKGYGKITNYSGKIAGVPVEAECAEDGYLMIKENGALSFHSVNLQLFAMTLRATDSTTGECAPSVYYKSYFKGDEIVAQKVQKYGVALSVTDVPDADNLDTACKYSAFDTAEEGIVFNAGSAGNQGNGTLLKGIMKTRNAALINNRNANMDVYGRAYILTEDGYMFGTSVKRPLKEQTQLTDERWTTLSDAQKESLIVMYNTYAAVMKNWNIPNIRAAAEAAQSA